MYSRYESWPDLSTFVAHVSWPMAGTAEAACQKGDRVDKGRTHNTHPLQNARASSAPRRRSGPAAPSAAERLLRRGGGEGSLVEAEIGDTAGEAEGLGRPGADADSSGAGSHGGCKTAE